MHFLSVSTAYGSRCPVQSGGVGAKCTDQGQGASSKGILHIVDLL